MVLIWCVKGWPWCWPSFYWLYGCVRLEFISLDTLGWISFSSRKAYFSIKIMKLWSFSNLWKKKEFCMSFFWLYGCWEFSARIYYLFLFVVFCTQKRLIMLKLRNKFFFRCFAYIRYKKRVIALCWVLPLLYRFLKVLLANHVILKSFKWTMNTDLNSYFGLFLLLSSVYKDCAGSSLGLSEN